MVALAAPAVGPAVPADDKAISPFVNEATQLVVRIDLNRGGLDAVEELLARAVPSSASATVQRQQAKVLRTEFRQVRQPLDALAKAGVRRVYWLYNSRDPLGGADWGRRLALGQHPAGNGCAA